MPPRPQRSRRAVVGVLGARRVVAPRRDLPAVPPPHGPLARRPGRQPHGTGAPSRLASRQRRLHGGGPRPGRRPGATHRSRAERAPAQHQHLVGPAQRRAPRPLELAFGGGVLAAWRAPNFERVYDLAERVMPAAVRDLPVPSEDEAQRELVSLAAACSGVATARDLADYLWLRPTATRLRFAELVEEGRLVEVAVEGWGPPPTYAPAPAPGGPGGTTRPSPTAVRLPHLDEGANRAPLRLPLPHRDLRPRGTAPARVLRAAPAGRRRDHRPSRSEGRPCGRLSASRPRLPQAHAAAGSTADAVAAELHRMRQWLGLERVEVEGRGDLAPGFAGAVRARGPRMWA